jgi:hypothetical protein
MGQIMQWPVGSEEGGRRKRRRRGRGRGRNGVGGEGREREWRGLTFTGEMRGEEEKGGKGKGGEGKGGEATYLNKEEQKGS